MAQISLAPDTVTEIVPAGSNSARSVTIRNNSGNNVFYSQRPDVSFDNDATMGMLLKPDELIIYERSGADLSAPLYAVSEDVATLLVERFHG